MGKKKKSTSLASANKTIALHDREKEKRAAELVVANKELRFQNSEKEKRANELIIANKELLFQNKEKEMRAEELIVANKELLFQNKEKEMRAEELIVANQELAFQNAEKEKRANELVIVHKELAHQHEEKEKREAQLIIANYARSLIEASRDPMFAISPQGKITDVNSATEKIIGKSRENLIDTDFFSFFTEPETARKGYEEIFAKGFVTGLPLTITDHQLTDVLFNGSVYRDERGKVVGVVVVARDITEQNRITNELTEAKVFAELSTVLAEDAKLKAENATHIAESAVKAKQQFLSNMSHEIRTPMNAILGFTKVLLKTGLTAKQKEYLNAIKISGDSLVVLINDILDLAKVDAGKMTFEQVPFRLSTSISAMLHLFEPKIQEKNLKLVKTYDPSLPEFLIGDPVRLHQIILNLLSNAVKFTSAGRIEVSVKMLKENDTHMSVEFAVMDTGIGILAGKMSSIFEDFQQASSGTSRIYGGTGLGLAIVKQLVESQGGRVSVESEFSRGSTFSFVLDFLKQNGEALIEHEVSEHDQAPQNINVLVVEDIALNQLLMKTLLDDFGFERDIASNGRIAIEKLQTKMYDVILMDLQMPELNGFEATKYIRTTMKLTIPIIALTADVTTVDLEKCKTVGMNDYISKPVDEKLLYSKIVSLVKKANLENKSQETLTNSGDANSVTNINLKYLHHITKSDPKLMTEMIELFLKQTPELTYSLNQGLINKNWELVASSAHKLIPSFSIVGIDKNLEIMAKTVQESASTEIPGSKVTDMIKHIITTCNAACQELKAVLINLKKSTL